MNVGRGGILQIIKIYIIRKCFLTFLEPKVFEKNGLSSWKSREKIEKKTMKCHRGPIFTNILFLVRKIETESSNLAKRNDALKVANLSETVSESFKLYKTCFFVFCAVRCYEGVRNQWWSRVVLTCPQKRS